MDVRAVCVYCASSVGVDGAFAAAADSLGGAIARAGLRLVYGGGQVGLMGRVANAALAAGGEVVGVIPRDLFSTEVVHRGLTELHEVASMHERKQAMYELADAFVALPGGYGTLEELAEIVTWSQLGLHRKPIVLADVGGFWSPLVDLFDAMVATGFLKPANRARVGMPVAVEGVLDAIAAYSVEPVARLITPEET